MANHRLISLLTVLCNVLEKVMYNRLGHHMNTNNVLVTEQFGFRQGIANEYAAFKQTDNQ
jgi:hypothetical protein